MRFAIGAACALVALAGGACRKRAAPPPLETAVYVWQQKWTPQVVESVERAKGRFGCLMIFAGEARFRDGRVSSSATQPDWPALAHWGKPVALVFRMGAEFAPVLGEGAHERAGAVEQLARFVQSLLDKANADGVAVESVQIDYDCPTARLADYAALMRDLRRRLPESAFSITALPTWLGSRDFSPLVEGLRYFVLQAHSIEKPRSIDQPNLLCDTDKIPGWLKQLHGAPTPFFIALPTYGCRVVFDAEGRFVGFMAENDAVLELKPGFPVRLAMADPVALAAVVRALRDDRPPRCRGAAWFRLPVAADRFNWPWPTLEAVIEGREPAISFRAEARHPDGDSDLVEIWVDNTGEGNLDKRIGFALDWNGRSLLASDVMNGFARAEGGRGLMGPAPRIGRPVLAGWFRLAPAAEIAPVDPKIGPVEACP